MSDIPAKHWNDLDGIHIDVSGLSPPEPMVAILQLIENPETQGPVIVHHNREPIHLYPELNERGWNHEIIVKMPGKVCLKLMKWQ